MLACAETFDTNTSHTKKKQTKAKIRETLMTFDHAQYLCGCIRLVDRLAIEAEPDLPYRKALRKVRRVAIMKNKKRQGVCRGTFFF